MPELPEVQTFRVEFEDYALNHDIVRVKVYSDDILEDMGVENFIQKVKNTRFDRTKRWGKFLFARISGKRWVVFHFGMSGYFRYISSKEERIKHDHILFWLKKGESQKKILCFNCQRKFGRVGITRDVKEYMRKKKFGPDIYGLPLGDFKNILSGRDRSIKSALLAQRVVSGLGNLYIDESLFQSGIKPTRNVSQLNQKELETLHNTIQRILRIAIDNKADYGKFPEDFFINFRKKGENCPKCGSQLRREKVAGRTTYFCPSCQN